MELHHWENVTANNINLSVLMFSFVTFICTTRCRLSLVLAQDVTRDDPPLMIPQSALLTGTRISVQVHIDSHRLLYDSASDMSSKIDMIEIEEECYTC